MSKRKGEEKENICEINENRKGNGTEQQGGIIRKRLGSVSIFSLSKIMKFILDAYFSKIYALVNEAIGCFCDLILFLCIFMQLNCIKITRKDKIIWIVIPL